VVREHHSATRIPPSRNVSDLNEYNYDLTASNEIDCVSQSGDLDVALKHTFFVEDVESPFHGQYYHQVSKQSYINFV